MASPADITAIIVTYNSQAVIQPCLAALKAEGVGRLVVDNASQDDTVSLAQQAGAVVVEAGANLGFGTANNLGVQQTTTDWVLFINPDAVVQPGSIARFIEAIGAYPEAGIFGPQILEADGRYFFQPRSFLATFLKSRVSGKIVPEGNCCVAALSGACMLMRRDLFLALGGFDPEIFLFYEDDDLCRKVADHGLPILYVHEAVVSHLRGQSSTANLKSMFLMRACQAWSRAYVAQKYGLPHHALPGLLVNGAKYLVAALSFNAKRRARYGGSFVGTLRALLGQPTPR